MKVCHVIELKTPTKQQITTMLDIMIPNINNDFEDMKNNMINYIQGDLRKLTTIYRLHKNNDNILNGNSIKNIFIVIPMALL